MNDKYKELFGYISDTDESCASDILYSLELVKTSLNTTLKRIKKEIQIATDNDSFDGISQIAGYCKQITDINTDIEQLITALHLDKAPAPIKQEKQETIIVPPSTGIVDYSAFDVNRTEPHTLDEDFENKKICGFNINDVHISANSWQDGRFAAHVRPVPRWFPHRYESGCRL